MDSPVEYVIQGLLLLFNTGILVAIGIAFKWAGKVDAKLEAMASSLAQNISNGKEVHRDLYKKLDHCKELCDAKFSDLVRSNTNG